MMLREHAILFHLFRKNNQMLKFFDQDDLIDRLAYAYSEKSKNVVFIVGSPLTAPHGDSPGVCGVDQIVCMIRAAFANDKNGIAKLDRALASTGQHSYQSAFDFLNARRGPAYANEIIRKAVLNSRLSQQPELTILSDESQLGKLENEISGWHLSAGVKALGEICHQQKNGFGQTVLTTNFDPLLEIAVKRAGGEVFTSMTHSDGNISQTIGSGVHVVHLHGYWRGSDTLHTPAQLTNPRPKLKNSLAALIKNSLVVVLAYGGWDDVITESISSAVADDASFPEVIWTFYSSSAQDIEARNTSIIEKLRPGISRGRVTLYNGINCHELLPVLVDTLNPKEKAQSIDEGQRDITTTVLTEEQEALVSIADNRAPPVIDAFPKNDIWFGREQEVSALITSTASLISISGMGGQGKSALASNFMQNARASQNSKIITDWRDCREQASTIHLAVAGATARITGGSTEDLAKLPFDQLAFTFANRLASIQALIVFDNIDQYVDLENSRPLDQLKLLIDSVLAIPTSSKVVFTSRPRIAVEHVAFQEIPLAGLSKKAAKELFEMKSAQSINESVLEELFELTQGHPLWISFVASQCSATGKEPAAQFAEIRAGKGDLPENTMRATWRALSSKGQQLLRILAELERPEQPKNLDGVAGIKWNQLTKALNNLDKMSLIVHREQDDGSELIDLHPLVRSFVRREFPKKDRQSFINYAINFVQSRLDRFSRLSGVDIPFEVLDIWLHKIELQVNQQDYQSAIETIDRVSRQLLARALHEEMLRLSKRIMLEIDWSLAMISYNRFDVFVAEAFHVMVALDGIESAEKWILRYESNISGKGVHYINLCEIRAYVNWFSHNFSDAIHWAELGVTLKKDYDVQTPYDCAHTLALAKRDSGRSGEVLEYFLYGESLDDCLDENVESQRDGIYYGNIGRCLHLMGELPKALKAFRKVARLFERDGADALNQGFIRFWVGQTMEAIGRVEDAVFFYIASFSKWEMVSPFRAGEAQLKIAELIEGRAVPQALLGTPVWKAENRFVAWSRSSQDI